MWGWRRPAPGDGLIALLIILLINLLLMPVLGIAGLMSDNEGEKIKGALMLILGIVIWGMVIFH